MYLKPITRLLFTHLQYLIHKIKIIFLYTLELMFLETSALTGENVEEAFVQCARKILNKIESGKSTEFKLSSMLCHFLSSFNGFWCVGQVSWIQSGWVQVFSMAMQRYGSFVPHDELKLRVCRSVVVRAQ